jgi:hypothetical protein
MGIRLQIVLALSGLLVLAFVPLFVAVAALTRATVEVEREASARSIGRAVAAQVEEARRNRTATELGALLDSEIGAGGVTALGVYEEAWSASDRSRRRTGRPWRSPSQVRAVRWRRWCEPTPTRVEERPFLACSGCTRGSSRWRY